MRGSNTLRGITSSWQIYKYKKINKKIKIKDRTRCAVSPAPGKYIQKKNIQVSASYGFSVKVLHKNTLFRMCALCTNSEKQSV
jgi:hypothetical protein